MTASGYYDASSYITAYEMGAHRMEVGQLPDGRYAVDHTSLAQCRPSRSYFNTEQEARTFAEKFCGMAQ